MITRFIISIIVLTFIQSNLFSQCENPPTLSGNSGIVSSSDGDILINGVPCTQQGNSGNYNCNGVAVDLQNDTFIITDGDCVWIVTDGDWDNIEPDTGLPIELITFNVDLVSDYNLIQWSTASEMNNDRFVLEYSDNGFNWETIGAIKGSGNSSSRIDYSFEHRDFSNNINYYRLKQIDFDGQNETFNIISIDNRLNKKIMKVFNMMGQEVDINSKGLKVIIYDDGSSSKKMN